MRRTPDSSRRGPWTALRFVLAVLGFLVPEVVLARVDLRGTGRSTVWEDVFAAADLPGEVDTDGDGLDNDGEAVAGTDPWSAGSTLAGELRRVEGGGLEISWDGRAGKVYRVVSAPAPDGPWSASGGDRPGVEGRMVAPLPAPGPAPEFHAVQVRDVDGDGDGVDDWEEARLGLDAGLAQTLPGVPDAAAAQARLEAPTVVTLELADGVAGKAGPDGGAWRVRRSGHPRALVVPLLVGGTAAPGSDFTALPAAVELGWGEDVALVAVTPLLNNDEAEESVEATLGPGAAYALGAAGPLAVVIAPAPWDVYLADLRPEGAAVTPGSGRSVLRLAPDRTLARYHVEFANLAAPQTAAHIHLGAHHESGPAVHSVAQGQIDEAEWVFGPSGTFSVEDQLAALDDGRLYLNIHSSAYPDGEIRGAYGRVLGSSTFAPPAELPPWPPGPASLADAHRFLEQATFGPTETDLAHVQAVGFAAWLDEQMARAPTLHRVAMGTSTSINTRQEVWWQTAVTGPDQLRQRVAFALSEIFVISDVVSQLKNQPQGVAWYYDLLVQHAFGNYRDLLEAVTLAPEMGVYLTHLRNPKADPVLGTSPDENYAREIMQLFSIGLDLLHPDGTLVLDDRGRPIATYDNDTIREMAKIFTGWSYHSDLANPSWRNGAADWVHPMEPFEAYHEPGPKTIVTGVVLPAGQGAVKDLDDTLDVLWAHPNTGPFLARRLIQRLVTSTPSPGYVYRVARKYTDNGAGVRGDLGAMIRQILLDPEARDPAVAALPGFGKLKEPLLRQSAVWRAFRASTTGAWRYWNPETNLGQAALRAPSVFNFFEPAYILPGPTAAAGLTTPEFQITTDTFAIRVANQLRSSIFGTIGGDTGRISIDLGPETALAGDPAALADHLDTLLFGGRMPAAVRSELLAMLAALPGSTSALERARSAVHLLVISPDHAIQK